MAEQISSPTPNKNMWLRRSLMAAGLAGTVVVTAACAGETDNQNNVASVTTAASEELTDQERADLLHGDGETIRLTFDDLGANEPTIIVYTNPFPGGEDSGDGQVNDGDPFYADCYEQGRGLPSEPPETERDSSVWYLGELENGQRRFVTATYMAEFEEPVEGSLIEECAE